MKLSEMCCCFEVASVVDTQLLCKWAKYDFSSLLILLEIFSVRVS